VVVNGYLGIIRNRFAIDAGRRETRMPRGVYEHKIHSGMFKIGHGDLGTPESHARAGLKTRGTKRPGVGPKMSKIMRGKPKTTEHCANMSKARKGKPRPDLSGSNSNFWKGGVSNRNELERKNCKTRLWRESVFKRDNWTCQKYKVIGNELHPHHIQNFSQFPELRFDVDNGITLSKRAHLEFHKIYGQQNNTREQIDEFLMDEKKDYCDKCGRSK
jgi:hypothetical protein